MQGPLPLLWIRSHLDCCALFLPTQDHIINAPNSVVCLYHSQNLDNYANSSEDTIELELPNILQGHHTYPTKFITTLCKLAHVLQNCIILLHLHATKFVIQCQLPVVTIILRKARQCFPHSEWSFSLMKIQGNIISNSLQYYSPHFSHICLPLSEILGIRCWGFYYTCFYVI